MSRIRTVVATEILFVLGLLAFVAGAHLVEQVLELHEAIDLSPLGALVMSAVPGLLWLGYFHAQDRHEPEPTHYVLGVYLLGCFIAGPMSEFLTDVLLAPVPLATPSLDLFAADRLVRAFLLVALAQELCKYVVVRYTVYLSPEFDEPMDGLVYMTAAGIGFATWDNYQAFRALEGNVFLSAGAADAVITTLAHACFAGVMGYTLGRARFSARSGTRRSVTLFLGLVIAAALSGQFQLVESAVSQAGMDVSPWRGLAYAAGFAAVCFFVISVLMRRLLAISPFRPTRAPAEHRESPEESPDGWSDNPGDSSKDLLEADLDHVSAHPPAFSQRHALLVVIAALALLAAGRLAHRSLTTPDSISFDRLGLQWQRPSGWLPPVAVGSPPERFFLAGQEARSVPSPSTSSYHVAFTSPGHPRLRIEVQIAPLPRCANLAMALAVERQIRAGETYRAWPSRTISIAGATWLRTRFDFVPGTDTSVSPRVETGVEYAIARHARVYRVTIQGDASEVRELDEMIGPTLRIAGSAEDGASRGQRDVEWPEPLVLSAEDPGSAAKSAEGRPESATVVVVALDRIGGRLEPVSAGSGVVVTGDGAVLTAFHVLHDEDRERLHDLVVIGRPERFRGEPQLVCAGYPERGEHDRDRDLAIVRCEVDLSGRSVVAADWPTIPAAPGEQPELGATVRVLGYPGQGNGPLVVNHGTVLAWTGSDGAPGKTFVRTDALIVPGISGGPVIDERDRLIGIASGFRDRARVDPQTGEGRDLDPIGLFRPIGHAAELLAAAARGPGTARRDVVAASSPRHYPGSPASSAASASVPDNPPASGRGVTVLSRVVDAANDRPVAGALVIVFQPGTEPDSLERDQLEENVLTWGRSDSRGDFVLAAEIPRGMTYSVVVLADGFQPLDGRGALVLDLDAPDLFDPWGIIRLARE